MHMEHCSKCGGARFYGSGAIGWGGPICNCNETFTPPSQPWPGIAIDASEQRIMARIDRLETLLIALLKPPTAGGEK